MIRNLYTAIEFVLITVMIFSLEWRPGREHRVKKWWLDQSGERYGTSGETYDRDGFKGMTRREVNAEAPIVKEKRSVDSALLQLQYIK